MNITAKHRVICAVMAVHLAPVAGVTTLPAHAQAGVLEEVVVVARKREESLQDTPVAVSAFGADQLREAQITNVADLAQNVPGLSNKDGDRVSGLTIRGVGSRAVGAAVDPGVGVYVDGIFMPRSDTQLVDVVEMESIQVLRGPQGTLFGKNTAGGALLLQSRKPEEEFTIQVEGGLGERDRRNFAGRVDGPLVENTLYGAITYDVRKEDGYMDDFYTDVDYGDTDRQAVVGQLRWYPTEELTVDLIALWGERDENAAPTTCRVANPNSTLSGFASTTPGFYQDFCEESEALVDNEKVIMDSTGLEYDVTNNLAGVTVDWDLGEVTLKSVTGYLYQDDLKRRRAQRRELQRREERGAPVHLAGVQPVRQLLRRRRRLHAGHLRLGRADRRPGRRPGVGARGLGRCTSGLRRRQHVACDRRFQAIADSRLHQYLRRRLRPVHLQPERAVAVHRGWPLDLGREEDQPGQLPAGAG